MSSFYSSLALAVEILTCLPEIKYGQSEQQSNKPLSSSEDRKEHPMHHKCSICLAPFELGDELILLPCFHRYHRQCIFHWFDGKRTCPICMKEVKLDSW